MYSAFYASTIRVLIMRQLFAVRPLDQKSVEPKQKAEQLRQYNNTLGKMHTCPIGLGVPKINPDAGPLKLHRRRVQPLPAIWLRPCPPGQWQPPAPPPSTSCHAGAPSTLPRSHLGAGGEARKAAHRGTGACARTPSER